MSFKMEMTDLAKRVLGDDTYALLRHPRAARDGLKRYGPQIAGGGRRRSVLTCCPNHGNLGDHAIAIAERRMLNRVNSHPPLSFSGDTVPLLLALRRYATPEDTIYLHGGGNMGTMYRCEEDYRLRLIASLHDNRIILFPQTMSYEDTADSRRFLRHTQRVYGAHPDLHLFAREQVSYERMKAAYPDNDVRLVPDIVLSLGGQDGAEFGKRRGVLLCMRDDVEQDVAGSACRRFESIVDHMGEAWRYTDTTVKANHVSQEKGEELVHAKLDEFRAARLVITDRLHGMIFSAVTGTPCVALNNSNGKVGFEYEWLKGLPYIAFARTADEVEQSVERVMQVTGTRFPSEEFARLFAPLTALMEE